MVKTIEIENACITPGIVEIAAFTVAEGKKIAKANDFDYVSVEVRDNVMMIAHDDGQLVYVRQD